MRGTVKSKAEIDSLFKTGRRYKAHGLILIASATPEQRGRYGRVAYIAGKKLGNAPARNRAKRLLRHAVAQAGGPVPGVDMVFVAQSRLFGMDYSQIAVECKMLREKILVDLEHFEKALGEEKER